jgi:outer membrane protein assembly factor BamB
MLSRWRFALLANLLLLSACGSDEVILPGERLAVRPDTVASVQAGAPVALALPPARLNAEWNHQNGSVRGWVDHPAFGETPRLVWSADIGAGSSRRSRLLTVPVVAGGRVFTIDAEGLLSALTTQGQMLWQKSLVPPGQQPDSGPGGGMAQAGGILFVTTGFGDIFALDPATGGTIWRETLEAPIRAAPAVSDGRVFAVLRDDVAYAFDARTGGLLWRVQGAASDAGLLGGASPAVEGRIAVVPFSSGEVLGVLARNGLQVWSTAVMGGRRGLVRNQINDITGGPVIDGDTVYASNQSGRTVSLDRLTGTRNWTLSEGSYGRVWPVATALFLLSDEGELVRVDAASGAIIWSVQLPQYANPRKRRAAIAHYGPILAGGRLWVASGDGQVRAFSPDDGRPLGSVALPAGAAAAPAVAQGVMYVVSVDGQLNALQ